MSSSWVTTPSLTVLCLTGSSVLRGFLTGPLGRWEEFDKDPGLLSPPSFMSGAVRHSGDRPEALGWLW